MTKEYQVTLIDAENKYRPVSTLVKVEQAEDVDLTQNKEELKKIKQKGIINICTRHYWTSSDLKRFNYTKAKVRLYDREKIEKEKKENYWKVKKEKFATGEWTPNKADARRLILEEVRARNNKKE